MAQGVVVMRVARRSSAARVGLRPGDILLKINNNTITLVSDLEPALEVGRKCWRISIRREGQVLTTEIRG